MRRTRYIAGIALGAVMIASLTSCVTVSENMKRTFASSTYAPSVTDYPAIGQTRTAEVGETLIWKAKQTAIPAVDIEQPVTFPTENLSKHFVLTLLPGRYVEQGKDPLGTYYEGKQGSLLADGQPVTAAKTGIYVVDTDPSKTEVYVLPSNLRPLSYPKDGISFTKSSHLRQDELSFKRELVYTGVSKNVVFILYREFTNDFARPAFSQELKYDLSEDRLIGYRGARFEIISATNQGITYKTIKQLD